MSVSSRVVGGVAGLLGLGLCGACTAAVGPAPTPIPSVTPVSTVVPENAEDPRITTSNEHFVGARGTYRDVAAGDLREIRSGTTFFICLNRPGQLTIDRIDAQVIEGEVILDSFGVERQDTSDADQLLSLQPVVLHDVCHTHITSSSPVAVVDPGPEARTDLRLRLRKIGVASAVVSRLILHYTSNGRSYEFSLDWRVALCAPGDRDTPECRPIE